MSEHSNSQVREYDSPCSEYARLPGSCTPPLGGGEESCFRGEGLLCQAEHPPPAREQPVGDEHTTGEGVQAHASGAHTQHVGRVDIPLQGDGQMEGADPFMGGHGEPCERRVGGEVLLHAPLEPPGVVQEVMAG